ncbi:unnamed protein product [Effrenium voratum]|uniref:Uncharacterized protein n=1 Tax=Effrenium voratum TaxID=2562239 RepID=A0AA36MRC7_9DINO|nr:unnamed protein product [Effrenium voratum]
MAFVGCAPEQVAEMSALCSCVEAYVALGDATKAEFRADEACSLAKAFSGTLREAAPKLALVKSKLLGSKEGTDAMALLREIGATWGETALLLGLAKDATKDTAKARAALEQAKLKQNRWLEAFALLTLTLALQPKGSPGATAVDEFLALAKRHGIHVGEADAASSIRRLQGSGSTTQDLQEISMIDSAPQPSSGRGRGKRGRLWTWPMPSCSRVYCRFQRWRTL